MNVEIRIKIVGDWVELSVAEYETGEVVFVSNWQDKKDLSDKLLLNIDSALRKKKLSLKNICDIIFFCDSPYFSADLHGILEDPNVSSSDCSGKCGFTAWQTGEIMAKTLKFSLK